jgi:hypothetical protein
MAAGRDVQQNREGIVGVQAEESGIKVELMQMFA